jgi:flagellar biosynthesis/type III secretory pathway chaperone
MAGMIDQLLDIMNEQAQRYEELLGLSQEKKDAIVKNDVEHLQKITHFENLLVSQNQKLERKRMDLMKDIADVMGKKADELTLSALIELMDGQEVRGKLTEAGNKIRDTLTALSDANDLNASLIQNALDYLEYSVNVIQTSVNQGPATFSVKGGQLKEDNGLFDSRK